MLPCLFSAPFSFSMHKAHLTSMKTPPFLPLSLYTMFSMSDRQLWDSVGRHLCGAPFVLAEAFLPDSLQQL